MTETRSSLKKQEITILINTKVKECYLTRHKHFKSYLSSFPKALVEDVFQVKCQTKVYVSDNSSEKIEELLLPRFSLSLIQNQHSVTC